MSQFDELRIDRNLFQIKPLEEQGDDSEYWASKTPEERLQALEIMRQIQYGYDPATERMVKVMEIKKQPWS